MSPSADALLGRTIASKYVIESYLGGGSMGAVYRARQVSLEKSVAIKVLRSDLALDPSFAVRFHREAKAASRLDHPNSIRIFDYGEESDGLLYIAMELLHGRSLNAVLAEESPLSPERIVSILSQVLAALAVAHDAGIVHRDLKPENIMVAAGRDDEGLPADHVKVCDFGIAKVMDATPSRANALSPAVEHPTQAGVVIGTPEYMSPEQGQGLPLDARSDIYAVGVILYQMLTGVIPFDAPTPLGTVMKHLTEVPRPPSELNPQASPRLEEICLRALQKDRDRRYQSAREMRGELRTVYGFSAPFVLPVAAQAPRGPNTLPGIGNVPARAMRPIPSSIPPASGPDDGDPHGTLALLAGSVLPPPRRRSGAWALLSAALIAASAVATAAVVGGNASLADGGLRAGAAAGPRAHRVWEGEALHGFRLRRQARSGVGAEPTAENEVRGRGQGLQAPSAIPPIARRGGGPAIVPLGSPDDAITAPPLAPSSSASLGADAPAAPVPPTDEARGAARVAFGSVHVDGLDGASVRKLVHGARGKVARCYQDAVRIGATTAHGRATLSLSTDIRGQVTRVAVAGIELPAVTELCISDAFQGSRIGDDADAHFGSAEVMVDFSLP